MQKRTKKFEAKAEETGRTGVGETRQGTGVTMDE
jgi:hypothetical protein